MYSSIAYTIHICTVYNYLHSNCSHTETNMYQYSQHATTKSFYIYTNTVFIIQSIYITTEYNLGIPSKKNPKIDSNLLASSKGFKNEY